MWKTDLGLIAGGVGAAVAPAVPGSAELVQKVLDIPFYETHIWLGTLAVIGLTTILLTGIHVGLKAINEALSVRKMLRDDPLWDGKDRRESEN